jgi:hypothetical protein
MPHTRRPSGFTGERVVFAWTHAEVTATTTIKLWTVPRRFVLERVMYNNITGLATHADDWFDIQILNVAAVAANHSTDTGQEGTISANTPVDFTMTAANAIFAAGALLSLKLEEGGTATLPTGHLMLEGRYL